ncbi:unnamed protein product [Tuber aestivum]|uniref:Uncharacterized protein n=1 Tax=Tuber aestivum TaxID=59557 RepID=A0A292Q637_9PEZI|nr:unnamed protein product [Tuber aestivum]
MLLAICCAALDSGTGPAPPTLRISARRISSSTLTPSPSNPRNGDQDRRGLPPCCFTCFATSLFRNLCSWPELDWPYFCSPTVPLLPPPCGPGLDI